MSIEPLPPELAALIASAPEPSVAPAVEARLLSRLDTSIAFTVMMPPSPLMKLSSGASLLVVGMTMGAGIHALVTKPSPEPVIAFELPPAVVSVIQPEEPTDAGSFVVPELPEKTVPLPRRRLKKEVELDAGHAFIGAPMEKTTTTLEAERRLLEPARAALARGMSAQVLDLLGRHLQAFPEGQLVEEREALWVQALAQSGETDSARLRAGLFRERFPKSFLLPVVERAISP